MDGFWDNLAQSLHKKIEYINNCVLFKGCTDKYGYGRKAVSWPYGVKEEMGAHRLSYLVSIRTFNKDLPRHNAHGEILNVSHLCHNKLCLNPQHLCLETNIVNRERQHCVNQNSCTMAHQPHCIIK